MRRAFLVLLALVVVAGGLTPLLNGGTASAVVTVPTQRSLTIGSGLISTSTSYTFAFVPGQTAAIQGLKFQACTTALGACTAPSGLSFSGGAFNSLTGTWTTATNFTFDGTGASDCIPSASILCAKRTQATAETGASVRGVKFTAITNPNGTSCATINCTFFVRMNTYSVNTYVAGNIVDTGTVASSTTQTLTINATIQETLTFCIGATTIDNATSAPPACASISGTSLNLGTLDSAHINVSPVASVNGDSNNGIAELSTNATNGSTVAYDSIQQSGTLHLGTLRVAGATCVAGTPVTDQCINAIGTTKAAIVTGTEAYGMTIAGVNCAATTAYACTFAGGTYNLIRDTNYNCQGSNTYIVAEHDQITGTSGCSYAWDETGTSDTIASSTSPNGPVDKEALILKFAATPNIITPTGSYTAKADFVATPTF